MADYERNAVEHTFTSGRTFLIRKHVPLTVLLFKSIEGEDEGLADGLQEWVENEGTIQPRDDSPEAYLSAMKMGGKVTRMVIQAMFLAPKIAWDSEDPLPEGTWAVEDLHDSEMNEVVDLAMKSVREAARFPDDTAGTNGGSGGEDVEQKPKPAARAKPRKR